MTITSALIHIANEKTLMTWLGAHQPDMLVEGAMRVAGGLARTATVPVGDDPRDGPVGLYANLTAAQLAEWQAMGDLGITILGQRPYDGMGTGPALYAQVKADPAAWTKWEDVATIPEHDVLGEEGETVSIPARVARPYVQ